MTRYAFTPRDVSEAVSYLFDHIAFASEVGDLPKREALRVALEAVRRLQAATDEGITEYRFKHA